MIEKAQNKFPIKRSINDRSSQKNLIKSLSQTESFKFNKFDIVWAKITGYPWWPAIVTSLPEQKESSSKEEPIKNKSTWSKLCCNSKLEYRVDFIADDTHAFLKKNYLLHYLENRDRLYAEGLQFSIRKRRYFQMAINEADQLQQVLEISKVEADKSLVSQKKEQNRQKQSEIIKEEKTNKLTSQIQQEFEEQLTHIKKSTKIDNKIGSERFTIIQSKISQHFSMENTSSNQKKNLKHLNNLFKEQDNMVFVMQSNQKRKGKLLKIVESQSIKLAKQKGDNNQSQIQIKKQIESAPQQKYDNFQKQKQSLIQIGKQQNILQRELYVQVKLNRTQVIAKSFLSSTLNQSNQNFIENLLQKYNLHTLDDIESDFKKKISQRNQVQTIQNKRLPGLKGSKSIILIKNAYSNFNKRKIGSRESEPKYQFNQSNNFTWIFSYMKTINQSKRQKGQKESKRLIQFAMNYTARKIYNIVLTIMKKNEILFIEQEVKTNIRLRCKTISQLIYDQKKLQDTSNVKNQFSSDNKKRQKKQFTNQSTSLFTFFKKKIQTTTKLLKFLSQENWNLIIKMTDFPEGLSYQIKSFQQFLEKQCHLKMKNEERFQDIVKQIGIENQKTAFLYGSFNNQIQIENSSVNVMAQKDLEQKNQNQNFYKNIKNGILESN